MDAVLAGFDSNDKPDYYMNVREFAGGAIEAVLKVVRPMSREQMKRRYEESGARTPGYLSRTESDSEHDKEMNRKRAVRRAKQSIRWLAKEMQADRLLTLTYRENMEDRDRVQADFKRFVRLLRESKQMDGWQYVCVLEQQSRGAYHIHCAVRGWQKISVIRRCWYRAIGGVGDEVGQATPGQVDVTAPRHGEGQSGRSWKTERLAGYISKYLDKTFDETTTEKKRYWSSRGLKKPEKHRVWIGSQNITDAITNAVGMLQTFYGIRPDFDMWLSSSADCFWIGGRIESYGGE
jgi:hypothetical protein